MEEPDKATASFYSRNAETYAGFCSTPSEQRLNAFLARLTPSSAIIELGCGNGRDSAFMIGRGYRVTPTDGTAEMAQQAELRLGIPVQVLRFETIDMVAAYDGVWANACLLHVPRADLPDVVSRIHRALRPGGVFYASYKAGEGEGHDRLGRYYNNPTEGFLRRLYGDLRWSSLAIEEAHGGAYDGEPTCWLHVTAEKSAA